MQLSPEITSILSELSDLEKKTTQGEWKIREHPSLDHFFVERAKIEGEAYGVEILGEDSEQYPTKRADAQFIVLAKKLAMALNATK